MGKYFEKTQEEGRITALENISQDLLSRGFD